MHVQRTCLPGTVFPADDVAKEGGRAFFNKVFYVSEHIMLSHIREITGLDTMALQNWVKRKWVPNPEKKYYNREHLNYYGSLKYTDCITYYIKTHYDIPDRRGDEKYARWEQQYERLMENMETTYAERYAAMMAVVNEVEAGGE